MRGGKQPGAGRPNLGLTQRTIRATDTEYEIIKRYLKKKHKEARERLKVNNL